jgi:hypothetical protein
MKSSLLIAFVATLCGNAFADTNDYPEVRVPREFKSTYVYPMPREELEKIRQAGLLSKCPHGHSTLVDVPVHGGFALTDDQIDEVNNYKWWPGGCTRGESNEINIRCTTCDYMYEQYSSKWTQAKKLKKKGTEQNKD